MKKSLLIIPMVAVASIVYAQSGNVQDTKGKKAVPAISTVHKYPGEIKRADVKPVLLPGTQVAKHNQAPASSKSNNLNHAKPEIQNKTK